LNEYSERNREQNNEQLKNSIDDNYKIIRFFFKNFKVFISIFFFHFLRLQDRLNSLIEDTDEAYINKLFQMYKHLNGLLFSRNHHHN